MQLAKIKLCHVQKTKDYWTLVDNFTVQELAYIEKTLQMYSEGWGFIVENYVDLTLRL